QPLRTSSCVRERKSWLAWHCQCPLRRSGWTGDSVTRTEFLKSSKASLSRGVTCSRAVTIPSEVPNGESSDESGAADPPDDAAVCPWHDGAASGRPRWPRVYAAVYRESERERPTGRM